ncbi:MAG: NAD(+) synthase [Clostridiaceae bacterium]|nr:NAD(+) synthase [Clostridiaceae bacterium]
MQYGFIKAAAVTPKLSVADTAYNAREIATAIHAAAQKGARIIVTPELCITGYTCADLFLQPTLLDGAEEGLRTVLDACTGLDVLYTVGLPVRVRGKLYNCAAVAHGGTLLGVVPKTHLPNYGEFYELRHFTPADEKTGEAKLAGHSVPFGTRLLFRCPYFTAAAEICEDLWAPCPPSIAHAMAGADVILNLSASDETIGKDDYRRELVRGQSARLHCAYLYADAGMGESSTDMVFASHNLIAENGVMLAETKLFSDGVAMTEIDAERLAFERRRSNSFPAESDEYLTLEFDMKPAPTKLTRPVSRTPFIPGDARDRENRCETILNIQSEGLARRLSHAHCKTAVVGISGGLDSCLALLVAVRAMKKLGRTSSDVIAVTMPCFGTTKRTRGNAEILTLSLGATLRTVDITALVSQHFADIGHDPGNHNVVFENAQARARTYVLMDIANAEGGLVVGTGDLSELALGWATYNGDHMSMYGVNASVPKTLIRHIVRYCADRAGEGELRDVLLDILATPVSPELLPAKDGEIAQKTEDLVGPYELHDFILYYALRWGFCPEKVLYLLQYAFEGEYDRATLVKWLKNFYRRFFAQQYKRSCLPDGPKVGSVALSPRGDLRMPSDASAALWLRAIDTMEV